MKAGQLPAVNLATGTKREHWHTTWTYFAAWIEGLANTQLREVPERPRTPERAHSGNRSDELAKLVPADLPVERTLNVEPEPIG